MSTPPAPTETELGALPAAKDSHGRDVAMWIAQRRFPRSMAAFLLVLCCYWLYGICVVPLVEPQQRSRLQSSGGPYGPDRTSRIHAELAELFQPGDWERESPIVLETAGARLLMKDYHNTPEGNVEIRPCTIVLAPDELAGRDEDRDDEPRIVVLQAPEGAVLRFDKPLELKRAEIGKLIGGRLTGKITIRSNARRPDGSDGLYIETQDVDLSPVRITTPNSVKFQLGRSFGSGRGLTINLVPDATDAEDDRPAPLIGGFESIELSEYVKAHLDLAGATLVPGGEKQAAPDKPLTNAPVEVTSHGPFRFEFEQRRATFNDGVEVRRLVPQGPPERLSCRRLEVHFTEEQVPAATAKQQEKQAVSTFPKLVPERLVAVGDRVEVVSPESGVAAYGRRLEYELIRRRASLTLGDDAAPAERVHVTFPDGELYARELHFERPANDPLGRMLAVGPGKLAGRFGGDHDQPSEDDRFAAAWEGKLQLRRDGEQHLLSVEGGAKLESLKLGGLVADAIHLWLDELPAVGEAEPRFAPDRMLATQGVEFDSPRLIGGVEHLEVWFDKTFADALAREQQEQSGKQATRPRAAAAVAQGPPGEAPPSNFSQPNADEVQYRLQGQRLKVQLTQRDGKADLAEALLEKNAVFAEVRTRKPDERPLLVQGERLHVQQPARRMAEVRVTGAPGQVEGRGMKLVGAEVVLSTRENRVNIDGAGTLTLWLDRDLEGKKTDRVRPLNVGWQGRMHFDGLTAHFEREVTAQLDHETLRTATLDVSLNQRINFRESQQAEQKPDVARLACQGGVYFERRRMGPGGQEALQRIETGDMVFDRSTGKFEAQGPGWMHAVQYGSSMELAGSGQAAANQPAAQQSASEQLTFVGLKFNLRAFGNLNHETLVFTDRVRAIYGPVQDWETTLDPDRPEKLGPDQALLTCSQLLLNAVPGMANKRQVELVATGNPFVEGRDFSARATRMTYNQPKDLLTLEGERSDAHLSHQERVGGKRSEVFARKILFWRTLGEVRLEDTRFGQGQG